MSRGQKYAQDCNSLLLGLEQIVHFCLYIVSDRKNPIFVCKLGDGMRHIVFLCRLLERGQFPSLFLIGFIIKGKKTTTDVPIHMNAHACCIHAIYLIHSDCCVVHIVNARLS